MRCLIFAILFIPAVGYTQQAVPQPTPEQLSALAQSYRAQLISAIDQITQLNAQIIIEQKELNELKKAEKEK